MNRYFAGLITGTLLLSAPWIGAQQQTGAPQQQQPGVQQQQQPGAQQPGSRQPPTQQPGQPGQAERTPAPADEHQSMDEAVEEARAQAGDPPERIDGAGVERGDNGRFDDDNVRRDPAGDDQRDDEGGMSW